MLLIACDRTICLNGLSGDVKSKYNSNFEGIKLITTLETEKKSNKAKEEKNELMKKITSCIKAYNDTTVITIIKTHEIFRESLTLE